MSPAQPDAMRVLRIGTDVPDLAGALALLQTEDFDLVVTHDETALAALAQAVRARGLATSVVWQEGGVQGDTARLAHLAVSRRSFDDRLERAIADGELRLHYQPQLSAQDGRIAGVEALVRWQHPQDGLLSPARFLPEAESSGTIVELGRWVLQQACADARRWRDAGRDDLVVAVNLSATQLQRAGVVDDVRAALEAHRLPPGCIAVELSEAAAMGNVQRMRAVAQALHALGVLLVLDDFGVGASNLHALSELNVEGLKIDTSFVRGVDRDPGQAAIARAILELGHALGIRVVAEGVETEAELAFLRRHHCDRVQGYLFSPPVPSQVVDPMLRQRYLRPESFAAASTGESLLLVDDEENVLRALVRLFRRDGYRIHTAMRVEDAFELLAREPVQVILSDQRMPGTSGTQFLSQVKEMYPDTVRLVLSGYTDLATVTDAINRGAIYRFLTKPWDDEELRRQVQDAFRAARRT